MLIGIVSVSMPLPILRPLSCRSRMIGRKQPRRGVHCSEPARVPMWLLETSHLKFVTTRLQREQTPRTIIFREVNGEEPNPKSELHYRR